MAGLHSRGRLALGVDFVNESLVGSRFTGRLVGEPPVGGWPAVVPTVIGRAWVTGTAQYRLDPRTRSRPASCSRAVDGRPLPGDGCGVRVFVETERLVLRRF